MKKNVLGERFDPRTVGRFLKWALKSKMKDKITQDRFAEEFGISDARLVRRWISVGVDSLTRIFEIANYFGVPVEDVIFFEDDDPLFLFFEK